MTRQERLEFCKVCQHKKFNPKRGIICGITNDIATFEDSCNNYMVDEQITALENFRKEKQEEKNRKKEKIKKQKIKEKITRKDLHLIIGSSLFATFLIRLVTYSKYLYGTLHISYYYLVIIYSVFIISQLIKNRNSKRITFFQDFKFKTLFSVTIALINLIYVVVVLPKSYNLYKISISIFVISFIVCNLSYILVMPLNLIKNKILKINE